MSKNNIFNRSSNYHHELRDKKRSTYVHSYNNYHNSCTNNNNNNTKNIQKDLISTPFKNGHRCGHNITYRQYAELNDKPDTIIKFNVEYVPFTLIKI